MALSSLLHIDDIDIVYRRATVVLHPRGRVIHSRSIAASETSLQLLSTVRLSLLSVGYDDTRTLDAG